MKISQGADSLVMLLPCQHFDFRKTGIHSSEHNSCFVAFVCSTDQFYAYLSELLPTKIHDFSSAKVTTMVVNLFL